MSSVLTKAQKILRKVFCKYWENDVGITKITCAGVKNANNCKNLRKFEIFQLTSN